MVPVVNENDTVADDEIRFGDNDRIAALVANLIGADVLVLLTDTEGLFTADPRLDESASLIEEIAAVDEALDAAVGGAGSARGSGGMATKLAAARIASWSGVRAVIAAARAPDVVCAAIEGEPVGTVVMPHPERLSSRKLWIAFAVAASGRIVVDDGARDAARLARAVPVAGRRPGRRRRVRRRRRGRGRRRVRPGVREGSRAGRRAHRPGDGRSPIRRSGARTADRGDPPGRSRGAALTWVPVGRKIRRTLASGLCLGSH